MKNIDKLQKIIDESNKIVFFSGAGISTLSGIKDFRSKDGLYSIKYKWHPELILSHPFFYSNTEDFYVFYKDKFNCLDIKPNIIHKFFYELEQKNKMLGIITQNIDGLHTKAGSKKVYELHGTIYDNYCIKCGKHYDAKFIFESKGIPTCKCGGIVKPSVVLYGEGLDQDTFMNAEKIIKEADTLIVAGSSLTVYPTCDMVRIFRGKNFIILNRDETQYDYMATLVMHDDLKEIFDNLKP